MSSFLGPSRPVPSHLVCILYLPTKFFFLEGVVSAINTPSQGPDKFFAFMDEADDTSKRRDELKSDLCRFKDVIEKIVDLEI